MEKRKIEQVMKHSNLGLVEAESDEDNYSSKPTKKQVIEKNNEKTGTSTNSGKNVNDEKLKKELEEEEDRRKRDELDKRIREKDKEKTKKFNKFIENPHGSAISLTPEERKVVVERIKKLSRQKYLDMREEQQLDLFKRILDAEKKLFQGEKLTEAEIKVMELQEQIYNLALHKKIRPETQRLTVSLMNTRTKKEELIRTRNSKSSQADTKRLNQKKMSNKNGIRTKSIELP